MKPDIDMTFQVGRARLLNGPGGTPFPSKVRQTGADRISVSGVYHPEEVAGDSVEQRLARSLAFVQQWTGLAGVRDAVPVVVERQPQLSGIYRVRSADIDWLAALTVNGGTVSYDADLERIGASTAAVIEAQYVVAPRSTAVHAVTPEGLLFVPTARLHQNSLLLQVTRQGEGGGVKGDRAPGAGNDPVVGSLQFGIRPDLYYAGGCTVEMRHHRVGGHAFGDWQPAVGRQISQVQARDVRVTNGVIRCTWLGQDVAVSTADDGQIVVETWTGTGWSEVGRYQVEVTSGAPIRPIGTPTIVRNSTGSVTVKIAADTSSNSPSKYVAFSIDRGQRFVRFSMTADTTIFLKERGTPTAGQTVLTGGIRSTGTNSDGWGWVFAHDGTITADAGADRWSIGAVAETKQLRWMLGAYKDSTWETASKLVAQWWLAQSTTERFVGL